MRSGRLVPASASPFGPTGLESGDDPSNAALAIDASTATAWRSAWYRSAAFGNLEAGTGLLIDMGRPVRITSVRILLGAAPGADLLVRTTKTLVGVQTSHGQASITDASGDVRMILSRPKRARYLLIWFTLLPPDRSGTFQASVYNVAIMGTP